jgi:thymidine kinase
MIQYELITGPMFAGKTTMLIEKIRNCEFAENEKLLFNYAGDKRYSEDASIASHNKDIVPSIPINDCFEINKHITSNIKAIFIDEVQFLKSLKAWFHNSKQYFNNIELIVIAGLNYDIYGNNFNNDFVHLIYFSSIFKKHYLRSKCYICGSKADFTVLVNNNDDRQYNENLNDEKEYCNENKITELLETGNNKCVGSKEMYQPVCLHHALKVKYDNNFSKYITRY